MRTFDVDTAFALSGYNGNFKQSLKQLLNYLSKDHQLDDLRVVAYTLATTEVEADYSLTRWEADYLCGKIGVPYKDMPCQSALNYYASTNGKQNYFTLGVDSRGLPYFGRGPIQLTGASNYDKYGKKIGVDLVENPEKAMEPSNAYKILVAYILDRTARYVKEENWYMARRSVNGCSSCDLSKVQASYDRWLAILQKAVSVQNEKKKRTKIILSIVIMAVVMSAVIFIIHQQTKRK
jgi:hypothetical protein